MAYNILFSCLLPQSQIDDEGRRHFYVAGVLVDPARLEPIHLVCRSHLPREAKKFLPAPQPVASTLSSAVGCLDGTSA